MFANFISSLDKVMSNAKYVLNDTFATQNNVDNMVCLLENEVDKCKYTFFEINTIEDYIFLNEETRKGKYQDAIIVLNTYLDLSNC